MEYISSDTNVWIDFSTIQKLALPFKLPYTYLMNKDAIEEELLSPPGLGRELMKYGVVSAEITIEEFNLAQFYGERYIKLSIHDRIALSIAKNRNIKLLTGDKPLRNASQIEGVQVIGTLGIMDQLLAMNLIDIKEYKDCLQMLKQQNGGAVRLPVAEIESRLRKCFTENIHKTEDYLSK